MKNYELNYFISGKLKEEESKKIKEEIDSLISGIGTILENQNPIKITLAYPLKKESTAFFIEQKITLGPEKIKELEGKIRASNKILKVLILKLGEKTKEEKIAPIMPEPPQKAAGEKVEKIKAIEEKIEKIFK